MQSTNAKLRGRTIRILCEATGLTTETCGDALERASGDLKVTLVHLLSGATIQDAIAALARTDGHVRTALASLQHLAEENRPQNSVALS